MRQGTGREQEDELDDQRGNAETGDRPGPLGVDGSVGQQHARQFRDRNKGSHTSGGADGFQQARQDQRAADWP